MSDPEAIDRGPKLWTVTCVGGLGNDPAPVPKIRDRFDAIGVGRLGEHAARFQATTLAGECEARWGHAAPFVRERRGVWSLAAPQGVPHGRLFALCLSGFGLLGRCVRGPEERVKGGTGAGRKAGVARL